MALLSFTVSYFIACAPGASICFCFNEKQTLTLISTPHTEPLRLHCLDLESKMEEGKERESEREEEKERESQRDEEKECDETEDFAQAAEGAVLSCREGTSKDDSDLPIMHWEALSMRIAELEKQEEERKERLKVRRQNAVPLTLPPQFLSLSVPGSFHLSVSLPLGLSVINCPSLALSLFLSLPPSLSHGVPASPPQSAAEVERGNVSVGWMEERDGGSWWEDVEADRSRRITALTSR